MTKKKKTNLKDKPIGKKTEEKKHLINPKYANTFWTIVVLVILTIFFIVNNTKSVQERGPYPPNYGSSKDSIQKTMIDSRINFTEPGKDLNEIKKEKK